MSGDCIEIKKVVVSIQENGIIRDDNDYNLIGRLTKDVKYSDVSEQSYKDIHIRAKNAEHNFGVEHDEVKRLEKENRKLKDFCIWMTGCGYDFTQHAYFTKTRDNLLKSS